MWEIRTPKGYNFPREAFGEWHTLSMWKVCLIKGYKSVEAFVNRRLQVCGSFDVNVDVAN